MLGARLPSKLGEELVFGVPFLKRRVHSSSAAHLTY